ncbi:MAG: tetratricopeptide repeat protein [Gammaproteobacteria bacterium]|nr:tetratricopeptide repeat protein [Gammaproteobacteria bacterium]
MKGLLETAIELHRSGYFDAALEEYRKILSSDSANYQVYYLIGNLFLQKHDSYHSLLYLEKAIQANPAYAPSYNSMGLLELNRGNTDIALNHFEAALTINPNYADAIHNAVAVQIDRGQFVKAQEYLERFCALSPHDSRTLSLQANLHYAKQDYERVINTFETLLEFQTLNELQYTKLAISFQKIGALKKAIEAYSSAQKLNGTNYFTWLNKGRCEYELSQFDNARKSLEKSLELKPEQMTALNLLGAIAKNAGQFQQAIHYFEKALSYNPDSTKTLTNLGHMLGTFLGSDLDRAETLLNHVIEIDPIHADGHLNLAITLLRKGKIREGWQHYEWRWQTTTQSKRQILAPEWQGENPANATIYIYAEQGLGDELLFSSCIPNLARAARKTIIECDSRLIPLYQRTWPNLELIARGSTVSPQNIDYQVAVGSLPKFFRASLDDFNSEISSLVVDPQRVAYWRNQFEQIGPGPYIGFSWRSARRDNNRSPGAANIDDWETLFLANTLNLINLQYDNSQEELAYIEKQYGRKIHTFRQLDQIRNIDDTAAFIAALDDVVVVRNAVFALAGRLGKPVQFVGPTPWHAFGQKYHPWYPNCVLNPVKPASPWLVVIETLTERLQETHCFSN